MKAPDLIMIKPCVKNYDVLCRLYMHVYNRITLTKEPSQQDNPTYIGISMACAYIFGNQGYQKDKS